MPSEMVPGLAKLPSPQNVKMHSINFKNVLQWSPVTYHKGDVNYSVEYQSYYDNQYEQGSHEKGCTHISITECDLSNTLAIMVSYYLRVRAEYKGKTSEWANVVQFEPFDETEIGPPLSVIVKPRLNMLDIKITEPVNENVNISMREYFPDLAYEVSYWEDAEEKKIESTYIQQKMVALANLKPWTTYCLKVKPFLENRKTHPSSVICETTKDDGRVAEWKIIIIFLASFFVVSLVTLGIFCLSLHGYRIIKYIFFPSFNLPEHIKEYLKEPWLNSAFLPTQTKNLPEESFDKLSIISDVDRDTKLGMLNIYSIEKEDKGKEK
ncbi:interleukin-10 receptor subunit beta-like isoform X2 [Narcine bancroftii]|uniref:interleukin-10 receptor subunit beta-like isoform X2 n=1 Tax=Narcine bancroftii TaxID=1343680 RepID=UPI0038310D0E